MGLLAQIVGNFTRVVEFPFDKNELCPGVVAILVNMELISPEQKLQLVLGK